MSLPACPCAELLFAGTQLSGAFGRWYLFRLTGLLADERTRRDDLVHPQANLIVRRGDGDVRWWTWAGYRANATLAASLGQVVDPLARVDDLHIRLRDDLTTDEWPTAVADARQAPSRPEVDEKALTGLKFSDALPKRLALATLAARLADFPGATATLAQPIRWIR